MGVPFNQAEVFEEEFRRRLVEMYGPLPERCGWSPERIREIEVRLAVPLPAILRTCWALAGQHPGMRDGLEDLRKPEEVELYLLGEEGEALIFSEERQGVTVSFIRREHLADSNPPVFGRGAEGGPIFIQAGRLSAFLLQTLCWNAMQVVAFEGLGGEAAIGTAELERLGSLLPEVESARSEEGCGMRAFQSGGCVACVFPAAGEGDNSTLCVACGDEDDFHRLEERLGIPLSEF